MDQETGRPWALHARVPPDTLIAFMPAARMAETAAEPRPPEWQMTYTSAKLLNLFIQSLSEGKGQLREPAAWPLAYSAGLRTSTKTALPSCNLCAASATETDGVEVKNPIDVVRVLCVRALCSIPTRVG